MRPRRWPPHFVAAGFGALAGVVVVTLVANSIAGSALRFSAPEYFAVYLLAFCSFVGMGGTDPVKTALLQPGPLLFVEQRDFVWGLIASMYVANVVAVILVLATIPFFASVLRIPFAIIGPLMDSYWIDEIGAGGEGN